MSRRALLPRRTRTTVRLVVGIIAAAAVMFGSVAPAATAAAAPEAGLVDLARSSGPSASSGLVKSTLAGFTPGNLISDAVFTAKNTMTEAQIQAFFNSKVTTCRGGVDSQGRPIVCLKDFKITSVNRPADSYCQGYTGAANETAARIIHRVAQSCGINPQVLIVMLQKEQGLVTHTWPDARRYDIALGQGCPDDAPCDPAFIGFFHQIYGAARQMQVYMEGKYFTWFAPGKTWNILYHPLEYINGAWVNRCGSGPVYIANKATSAMYYYTPYQPNAAALAAGTGEAPCGAYGNRNFYNYFTDWFGSTQTPGSTIPTLSSIDQSSYVVAVDAAGLLWGYPFEKRVWGNRVQLGMGWSSAKSVLAVGDLNGDGHRDLILHQGKTASVVSGTGAGFASARPLGLNWSDVVLSTAAGDLNGDGIPDVLTTNAAGDLILWRGDDRGSFLPGSRIGWGWNGMSLLLGSVDLNGDGNADIIGRDAAGRLWAFYGNGRSGWAGSQQIGQGWGGMSAVFVPGDFTGDGVWDLAARTANGDLHIFPADGVGGIAAGSKVGNGWQTMTALAGAGMATVQPRALAPGAGDVDRDGAPDVLALAKQGTLHLYRGNGVGGWAGSLQIGQGWAAGDRFLTLGDFDGDGYRDLGRVTAGGHFQLYPGNADGGYGNPVTIGTGWQSLSLLVGGIDFDGDRKTDVIGRDSTGRLVLYRGDGNGRWASAATPIGYGWGGFDLAVNAGDFDGDGHADLILRATNSSLWMYSTAGNGSWGASKQIGYGWGGFNALVGAGDFDGNGTADVLARTVTGDLYLFRGDGRGNWGASGGIGWGWGGFAALG